MARRGVNGQLNMFDFIKSLETVPEGEVEMVSLMPVEEVEQMTDNSKAELEPVKVVIKPETPVMSRSYEKDGVSIEIAYLKYNKVRIQRGDMEPEIKVFGSSKEAVDYYVEQMQELEADE